VRRMCWFVLIVLVLGGKVRIKDYFVLVGKDAALLFEL